MATAPTVLKSSEGATLGPFEQSVADTVDGLLYMEDTANPGKLIVAAGNVLCGVPTKRAAVGEKVTLRVSGAMVVKASAAIAAGPTPIKCDAAGKVATGTPGTDHIIGFLVGPACTADGDFVTIFKIG